MPVFELDDGNGGVVVVVVGAVVVGVVADVVSSPTSVSAMVEFVESVRSWLNPGNTCWNILSSMIPDLVTRLLLVLATVMLPSSLTTSNSTSSGSSKPRLRGLLFIKCEG